MRVLLDTCVISEIRRRSGDPEVHRWVTGLDPEGIFLSVITIGELHKGVALLPESTRRQDTATWLLELEQQFSDRILPVDQEVVRIWGAFTAKAQVGELQIPASDGLIAATGIRHGLHVATRNTRHFEATGAMIVDPWQERSPAAP